PTLIHSSSRSICALSAFHSSLSYFSFFFLLLRPPPPSTLFPYTTLFRSRLLVERRRRPVDLVSRRAVDGAELIHGLAQHVHHPAERGAAHRHADALSQIVGLHPAHHAFGRLHRHRTHASFAQVLLHLGGHVNWFGNVVAVTGDMDGVVDRWQIAALESHVKHRPDHLHDVSHGSVFFRHAFS